MATGNFVLDNAEEDIFNGMTLNLLTTQCTLSPEEFFQHLEGALAEWRGEGRKGVWVHLPLEQVRFLCRKTHEVPPLRTLCFVLSAQRASIL